MNDITYGEIMRYVRNIYQKCVLLHLLWQDNVISLVLTTPKIR